MGFIEQYIKVPPLFRQIWAFFYLMSERFIEDSCRSTAAALTFQTLFAVVPLLTVMYTIFNAFEAFDGLSGTVQEFIFTNVVPENVAVVREYLDEFSTSATNLGVPSGILVSVTALLMLFTIERTFNDIWRVKEPRHGFQRFLVYWAILTLGPAVLAITAYTLTLPLISDVTEITGAHTIFTRIAKCFDVYATLYGCAKLRRIVQARAYRWCCCVDHLLVGSFAVWVLYGEL